MPPITGDVYVDNNLAAPTTTYDPPKTHQTHPTQPAFPLLIDALAATPAGNTTWITTTLGLFPSPLSTLATQGNVGVGPVKIASGKLRDRVMLQIPLRGRGATNQRIVAYCNVVSLWAHVKSTQEVEIEAHQAQVPENTYEITLRHGIGVRHDWRVIWKGKTMDVWKVAEPESVLDNTVTLHAKEIPLSTQTIGD